MDELLKGLMTEAEYKAHHGIQLEIDFDAELEELRDDFALYDAVNGDPKAFERRLQLCHQLFIPIGEVVNYTDDEVNFLLQEEAQRMRDDCLNEEMAAIIEGCMRQEEDTVDITSSIDDYVRSYVPVRTTLESIALTIDVKKLTDFLHMVIEDVPRWNYPVAPQPKILSSRTPGHEYVLEKRAENDLRRRNEGKRILSSRG